MTLDLSLIQSYHGTGQQQSFFLAMPYLALLALKSAPRLSDGSSTCHSKLFTSDHPLAGSGSRYCLFESNLQSTAAPKIADDFDAVTTTQMR